MLAFIGLEGCISGMPGASLLKMAEASRQGHRSELLTVLSCSDSISTIIIRFNWHYSKQLASSFSIDKMPSVYVACT